MKDYLSILGNKPAYYQEKYIAKHIPDLYEEVNKLSGELPFKERLYLILHHMTEPPKCIMCGGSVTFNGMTHGYHEFCSQKCSAKSELTKLRRKQTNIKLYGVEHYTNTDKMHKTKQERYGDPNYINSEKCKQTNLERYGVECNLVTEENIKKSRKTKQERYGDPNYVNVEKRKQTNLERYGVENNFQIQGYHEKSRQIKQERYGDPNYNNREKYAQTCLDRYGTKTNLISQKEDIRKTILERYGVPYYCMTKECRKYNNDSKPNNSFASLLDEHNIKYEREFNIDGYSYDFKIGDVLVEIDPFATHNSTWGLFNNPKEKMYHQNKSELAILHNYKCIHVWDWDDLENIIQLLGPKKHIYARKCVIREVPTKDLNVFLNNYHLQGTCRGQLINLGLYYNETLMQVMTFGKPRYNKRYEYELLRLCTHPEYIVLGGSQKLFKHFISAHNPKNIISYCDMSKFTGRVYNDLGFELIRVGKPSKHWYNGRTGEHITDNLLRQRGYDQLFKTNYGKGISNEELMIKHKFVEIYDCGQNSYGYH